MHLLTMFRKGLIKVGSRVRCVNPIWTDYGTGPHATGGAPFEEIFIYGKIYRVTEVVPRTRMVVRGEGKMEYCFPVPRRGMTERHIELARKGFEHFILHGHEQILSRHIKI